ncbi:hypothetical protein BDP27DRAFT_1158737, partial [Rhodocollybia butyracea]
SENEAHNRLRQVLNQRIQRDKILTYVPKWQKKALPKKLVLQTWNEVIERSHDLQVDWTGEPEVLVGI